jgi:hypothetical protein
MSDWNRNQGEGYGRSWTDIADEMEQRSVVPPNRKLADRLCYAESPQESIDAVLDEAAGKFKNCILFRVQNNVASVWGYRGWVDQTRATADFCASPVSGNPLEILTVYPNFHGTMPIEPAYVSFFRQLGLPYPTEISLSPVEVNGRIVGILYGDGGEHGRLRSTEAQGLELAARLSFGFALILIKNKIRGIGDG